MVVLNFSMLWSRRKTKRIIVRNELEIKSTFFLELNMFIANRKWNRVTKLLKLNAKIS